MKAITYSRYTDAAGLRLTDPATPEPAEGRVRIKVAAAGLNAWDWHMYRGEPTFMRLQSGLRIREPRVVGADAAGTVDAVGPGVMDPMGGLTALQALRDTGNTKPGARVLVWGASGGVGHLAVQIARALGAAEVDAVCSGANATWVAAAGAHQVFDYTRGEAPGPHEQYDVIVDTVSTAPLAQLGRTLADDGIIVIVGAVGGSRLLGPMGSMVGRLFASRFRGIKVASMLAKPSAADLSILAAWLADGAITPHISGTFTLTETPDACRELEAGHVPGKLVIEI